MIAPTSTPPPLSLPLPWSPPSLLLLLLPGEDDATAGRSGCQNVNLVGEDPRSAQGGKSKNVEARGNKCSKTERLGENRALRGGKDDTWPCHLSKEGAASVAPKGLAEERRACEAEGSDTILLGCFWGLMRKKIPLRFAAIAGNLPTGVAHSSASARTFIFLFRSRLREAPRGGSSRRIAVTTRSMSFAAQTTLVAAHGSKATHGRPANNLKHQLPLTAQAHVASRLAGGACERIRRFV